MIWGLLALSHTSTSYCTGAEVNFYVFIIYNTRFCLQSHRFYCYGNAHVWEKGWNREKPLCLFEFKKKMHLFIYFRPGIQITNYMHLRLKDSRFWYVSIRGRGTSEIRPNVGGKKKKKSMASTALRILNQGVKQRSYFILFFFYRKKNTLSKR